MKPRLFAMHAAARAFDLGLTCEITPYEESMSISVSAVNPSNENEIYYREFSFASIEWDRRGADIMAVAEVEMMAEELN